MKRWLSVLLLFLGLTPVHAETARIAVASNFIAPMQELAQRFEEETGHSISLAPGSSGKLFAQIVNQAPFDVFLSADTQKPQALIDQQLAVADSRFTYALGKLVLWAPDNDAEQLLKSGNYRKMAIANPRLAPYGSAAVEILRNLGLYEQAATKLVTGENITQSYQFVHSGNAQLGFIAYSQLSEDLSPADKSRWIIPETLYPPIRQDAVLLVRGQENAAARAFMAFLRSPASQQLITRYGYGAGN